MAMAMATTAHILSGRRRGGSSKRQLGMIYDSVVGRDDGDVSDKRVPFKSKKREGESKGDSGREREPERETIDGVKAGRTPVCPLGQPNLFGPGLAISKPFQIQNRRM